MTVAGKKILLVLDVNGLLLDTYSHSEKTPTGHPPGAKVGKYRVYKRPFCEEFLEFCFQNFAVGIWSSARQYNVDILVDFIFGDSKRQLLFSWNQSDCTDTGLKTVENKFKPLFLKELSKLWNKVKPGLPWEEGEYGPFNTLLIDDTPYKALRNPPNTAIFPYPYKVGKDPENILGGALRKYLEGLLTATNVQYYVKNHAFGQLAITPKTLHWDFYRKVLVTKEPVNISKKKRNRLSSTEPDIRTLEILQATDINQHSVAGVGAETNGVFDMVVARSAGRNGSHRTAFSQECEANNMSQNVVFLELQDGEKDILENKEVNLLDDNCVKDLQPGLHDQSLISNLKRKRKHKKKHTILENKEVNLLDDNCVKDLQPGLHDQSLISNLKHKRKHTILENKEVNLLDDNCVKDLQPGLHDQSLISNLNHKRKHKKKHTYHQDGHIKDNGSKRSSSSQCVERDLLKEKNAHSVHVQWKKHTTDTVDKHHRQNNRQFVKHHCDNFHHRQFGRGNYLQRRLLVDSQNYHRGSNQAYEVLDRGFQAHNYSLNENITMIPFIPFAQRPLVGTVGQNLRPNTFFYNGQYQAHSQRYNHNDSSQPQVRYNKRKNLSDGHSQHYHNYYRRKHFEQR